MSIKISPECAKRALHCLKSFGWEDDHHITELQTALATPDDDWQPIETAPKDKQILTWDGKFIYLAYWYEALHYHNPLHEKPGTDDKYFTGGWIDETAGGTPGDPEQLNEHYPTHWRPLPSPPQGQES